MIINRVIADLLQKAKGGITRVDEAIRTNVRFRREVNNGLRNVATRAEAGDLEGGLQIRAAGNEADAPSGIPERMGAPVETGREIPDLSSMPPVGELLQVTTPNNARLLGQLSGLNQKYGPYRIKIGDANYLTHSAEDGFAFMGSVYDDDGNVVGIFGRKIYKDRKGNIVVYNNSLLLMGKAQRKGFATAFNTAMENYYRRSGVHRIELHAAQDGSYAFARQGFEFNRDRHLLRDSVKSIKTRINEIHEQCSPADQQLLSSVLERFDGRVKGYPSPRELATLTGENSKLGETLMKGAMWHGVKFLQ